MTRWKFPKFKLAEGELEIWMKDNSGTEGNVVLTEKYFTKISPLMIQTEIEGGVYVHDSIEFEVEDIDGLFYNTIAPRTKETIVINNATYPRYIDVILQYQPYGGVQKSVFHGVIEVESLVFPEWYNQDFNTDTSIKICKFRCLSMLEKLRNVSIKTLRKKFDDNSSPGSPIPVSEINFDLIFISIVQLLTSFGDDVSYSREDFDLNIIYEQYTVDTATDLYPLIFENFYLKDNGLIPPDFTDFWKEDTNISVFKKENALNFLTSFLKDFQLIAKFTYGGTFAEDTHLIISTRKTGQQITNSDYEIKESTINNLSTEFRNAVEITTSGSAFSKKIGSGSRKFTYTTMYKLGTFNETNNSDCLGSKGYVEVLYILNNSINKVTNPKFLQGATGWDTTGSSVAVNYNTTPGFRSGGYAYFTFLNAGDQVIFAQNIQATNKPIAIMFQIRQENLMVPAASLQMRVQFKSGVNIIKTFGSLNGLFTITLNTVGYQIQTHVKDSVLNNFILLYYEPKSDEVIDNFTLGFNWFGFQNTFRITDIQIYECHNQINKFVGNTILDYFGSQSKKINRDLVGVNMLANDVNVGDYSIIDGKKYYLKKLSTDFFAHETEIDLIDY